jgi:spermidine synthase
MDTPARPTGPKLVHSRASAHHDITVTDSGFIRTLAFGPHRQSSMYLDSPFDTDFDYPGYLHLALALAPQAARTLAIGLGGGTVVKRMWRDYPEMRIDAVELDQDVIEIAHEYFALPRDGRIRVLVDDGRHFLKECAENYDIVIVDAFDGDVVPPSLTDAGFMTAARRKLTAGGVLVYNFIGAVEGEHAEPFSALHDTLASTWRSVWAFLVSEGVESGKRNIVLLASDVELTAEELLARIASRVDGRVKVPAFHLFGEDLWSGAGA